MTGASDDGQAGVVGHSRVHPDEYVRPRYPVDEPPTYRQLCACGWVGPERYAGVDVQDQARHAAQNGQ